MANFLAELKRRNVFKVATIYVVVSWLLLQIVTLIFPVFDIPMWASRLVVILLAIGFPVAVIMAWAFDLTPDGIEWDATVGEQHVHTHVWDWVLGVLLVVAIGLIVNSEIRNWRGSGTQVVDREAPVNTAQPTATREPIAQSIAVLPFVNMSGDAENDYFSDGMSEEILNLLAKIPNLKVIGRTSSFVYKGQNEDLRVIGRALGVSTLLEGSVRKSGDRIRITAQLIDVSDATHIWSETYDRTMTDVFEVQDDVAASIIDALQILVAANPTRGHPTESAEAYTLFLKARVAANDYEWQTCESLLLEAIEIDPAFAEAYELLAYSYWAMGGTEYNIADAQRLTGEASSHALAIAPDLALAKALYNMGDSNNYSMRRTIEALELAAQERPDDPRILDLLIYNLTLTGYMREALEVAERRVEVDPLSLSANGRMPLALFGVGRVDDGFAAVEFFDQLDLDQTHWFIGEVYLAFNRDDVAIESFDATLAQYGITDTTWVAELVKGGRDPVEGSAYLDRRIPEIVDSLPGDYSEALRDDLSYWYLYLGHLDRYFELIVDLEPQSLKWTNVDDLMATGHAFRELGFTSHPMYLKIAEQLGFIDVWGNRGPPDFCKKQDGSWICN
jgi:TolB-like protein